MVLSDGEIWEEIESGNLIFTPNIEPEQVSPSAIDLRLGYQFTTFPEPAKGFETTVDLGGDVDIEGGIARYGITQTLKEGETFTLEPKQFVLAYTLERIVMPNHLAARVEGRSSLGRMGISIHQTAPTVHATFTGHLRLEISHNGPFKCRLRPGQQICQLVVERLGKPSKTRLASQFQNQ